MADVDPVLDVILEWIVNIFLALSMAGCVATVLTFVLFKGLRTQPIKLVVYLCIWYYSFLFTFFIFISLF